MGSSRKKVIVGKKKLQWEKKVIVEKKLQQEKKVIVKKKVIVVQKKKVQISFDILCGRNTT